MEKAIHKYAVQWYDDMVDVLLKKCKEVALFDVVALSESDSGYVYQVGIDLNEDDTYWIDISCEQTIVEWERFMNKVM